MNARRMNERPLFGLRLLVSGFLLSILPPAGSFGVEREARVEEGESVNKNARPAGKLGFEAESKLKSESAGKSYFFLTNDVQWPEKKPIPAPPKPAVPVKSVISKIVSEEEPPQAAEKIPEKKKSAEEKIPPDTHAKPAARIKSGRTAEKVAADAPKKSRTAKKSTVAMPDIEQLLADVRRSAQPKLSSEPPPARPSSVISAEPAPISYTEVEGSVDMDALARDLASLQKNTLPDAPAGKKGLPAAGNLSPAIESSWWKICALVMGSAAAVYGLWFGASAAIRRRKRHIRSQAQIDAETRAFFDKLLAEQRRRAARPSAPAPIRPAAPPAKEEPVEMTQHSAEPEEFEQAPPAREIPRGPGVYLLPPELAEGAYKEAVKMAAMGESPHEISEKLNLGEGEVRLVLDIARLTRERLQTA